MAPPLIDTFIVSEMPGVLYALFDYGLTLKASTAAMLAVSTVAVGVPAMAQEVNGKTFTDVKETHQFGEAIEQLAARGIVNGFPDGTFKPGEAVTRGQAAKMLAAVLQLDTVNVVDPNFNDISKSHPYYGAIAALKQAGIIDGYPDGSFRSGGYIERNHMAKMQAGALQLQAQNVDALPFTDVTGEYKEAIAALYELQITTGTTPTTFDGTSAVKRGQLAAFIVRAERALANLQPTPEPVPEQPLPEEPIVLEAETVTISDYEYTTTTLSFNEKTYRLSSEQQKIFTEANRQALTGANITVTVKGDELVSVDAIDFRQAGTLENYVVFDAAVELQHIHIGANNIELKNVTVAKDVTVAGTVTQDVKLNNVAIKGQLKVEEPKSTAVASLTAMRGSVANTAATTNIIMVSSSVGTIIIAHSGTAITSDEVLQTIILTALVAAVTLNATVGQLTVQSEAPVTIDGEATIEAATVETPVDVELLIEGAILGLIILSELTNTTLGKFVTVTTFTLPEGATAEGMITNYDDVASQISVIVIPNAPAIPPAIGGGSSSGGSSGETSPSVDPRIATKKGELQQLIDRAKKDSTLYTEQSYTDYKVFMEQPLADANAALTGTRTAAQLDVAIAAFLEKLQAGEALLELTLLETYKEKVRTEFTNAEEEDVSAYSAASVANYKQQLSSYKTEIYATLATLTVLEDVERLVHTVTQKISTLRAQYLVDVNRPNTFEYAVGTSAVSKLPQGVTYVGEDTFEIAETFIQNSFSMLVDGSEIYVNFDGTSWNTTKKEPVEEYVTLELPYEWTMPTADVAIVIAGEAGKLTFEKDGMNVNVLINVFGVTADNLPDVISFSAGAFKLVREGNMYTLKDSAYELHDVMMFDDEFVSLLSETGNVTVYNNVAFIAPGVTAFKYVANVGSTVEYKKAQKTGDSWSSEAALLESISLPLDSAQLTFSEAIETTVELGNSYAVTASKSNDGRLLLTFSTPINEAALANVTQLSISLDHVTLEYSFVNAEWVYSDMINNFTQAEALEKAINYTHADYSYEGTLTLEQEAGITNIARLTYNGMTQVTTEDTALIFNDIKQYLRAIYLAENNFKLAEIVFDTTAYTWNVGSNNWQDALGNTLVEAIQTAQPTLNGQSTIIQLQLKDRLGLTYDMAIEVFINS